MSACTGALEGQNNIANSLTNDSTVNGIILGGIAQYNDASDTIVNSEGATIQNSTGDSFIYAGDNYSNTSNLTTDVTNNGLITNTTGNNVYIYQTANTARRVTKQIPSPTTAR